MATEDRSQSRGREGYVSSGRGGIGNIRVASASRDARPNNGPDDYSEPRGRDPKMDHTKTFSTGRGGAGNIRSPSRDVPAKSGPTAVEQEVIKTHVIADQNAVHSTGRGGIGNISPSRSRARDSSSQLIASVHSRDHSAHSTGRSGSRDHSVPVHHSTGRGGAGNGLPPGAAPHGTDDKELIAKKLHEHGDTIHSTARGGAGNIIHHHVPDVEHAHHAYHRGAYGATGRGGAGNMIVEE